MLFAPHDLLLYFHFVIIYYSIQYGFGIPLLEPMRRFVAMFCRRMCLHIYDAPICYGKKIPSATVVLTTINVKKFNGSAMI
jgi:hypothetical protein